MQGPEDESSKDSFCDSFIITTQNVETIDRWSRSVIVEGIDETQISVLRLLVTNKEKGGGELEELQIDSNNRRVLLTFKDKQAAEHFLRIGFIALLGTNFAVSKPILIGEEEAPSSVTASAIKRDDSWEEINPMAEEREKPIYFNTPPTGSDNDDPLGQLVNVVFVRDVPDVLTDEKLKNLLESNDLADAEDIKDVELLRDIKVAKITLFDSKVAAKLYQRQAVSYKDKVLRFCLVLKEDSEDSDSVFEGDGVFDTLKVTEVKESVSDEMLRLYFENSTRSGGGTVGEISPLMNGECVVKFKDPKVASRVYHRQVHQLDGISFSVVPLEKVEVAKCCAIQVEGLGSGHSEDLLRLYFEHQKFGDATVEDVVFDRLRGKAVVTFKHPQDVEKVLSHKTHILSKVPLQLSRLDPQPPAPLFLEQAEDTRLLATGLPPRTKLSDLQTYFGKLSGVRLTGAYLTNKPSKCLLEFEAAPDYKKLRQLVNTKPFRGVMISIRKVPLTTSIEVQGVCDLSDEILTLFFENRKNGGGKVVEIKKQPEQGRTFIKFETPDVISGLLQKTLKLQGRTLIVHWHHSFLDAGSIPLEEGTPARNKSNSFASLPPLRNRGVSEPSLSLYTRGHQAVSIRPSMMQFDEREERLKRDLENTGGSLNYNGSVVTPKGSSSSSTPAAPLAEVTVPEKMENLKPYHNRLLMLIGFEKQLMNDAGATQTKITLDEVSLFGSEDFRANVKIKVLEKLMSMIGKIQHVSEIKGKLMKRDAVQEYIHSICLQRDIKATLGADPFLQVCAFDELENVKLESILPSLVKELEFCLDVSNDAATSLSEELKKREEEIEFIIDPAQKKIRIACLDKDEQKIQSFVENFIRDIITVERKVSISQCKKDYIWRFKTQELEGLKQDLEKAGGSLECVGNTVTLKGNSSSVNSTVTRLQEIVNSLVEKSYTVDHPGGESFLTKSAQGKLILKGIESEEKALVTVRSKMQRSLSTNRGSAAAPDVVSSSAVGTNAAGTAMTRVTNDEGIVVTVVTGTVESQKVNVIVNSTSKDLVLNRGEISNSVLATAGSFIQDECKKTASLEFGKIVKTGGYNLPAKYVYHGAAMDWDGAKGKSLQVLKTFIKNCLQTAHADGMKSIAFPAIGAGTLKIPADVVVKTLFEEVENFSREHARTSLKDIRFVVFAHNQNVNAAFKSKLESFKSPGGCWKEFVRQALKPNQTKTSLTVLASSDKTADDVFKKIEDILKEETAVDRIDSAPDKEALGFLTNDQIRNIEGLQSSNSVRISLEPFPPSSHILVIKGIPKDVANVGRLVRQIIFNDL